MNPPTPEAIQRAMDTLVASAYQENPDPSQAQNDTSSLASTIYHIKMLKTALEGFKAVAEVELTRLEQHQNDVPIPIQTLAVEMLVQILHKTLSSQSWRDDLHRIAGVCKYWRSVILKFPEFWTNISSQTFDSPNPPLIRPLKKFSDAAFKLEITVLPVMRKILFRASPQHYKSRFRQRRPPVGDYEAGAWISTTCATAAFLTFENVLKCLSSGIVGDRPIHLLFDGETDNMVPTFPPLHPMEMVIPPSSVSILPGVETIKIKGTITADPLLQHLGESSMNTDGTISWPCPRLSRLDLSEWAEFEMAVIEELVARRWGLPGESAGGGKAPPLSRLLLPAIAIDSTQHLQHAALLVTSLEGD